jgi:hypothetical protein
MQPVVRVQPNVRDQPAMRRRQQSLPRGWYSGISVDAGKAPYGVPQLQAQNRVGFDNENAMKWHSAPISSKTGAHIPDSSIVL